MTYEEKIRACDNFDFGKVIEVSKSFLPDQYKRKGYLLLRERNKAHGTELLSDNLELCSYIASYGEMHYTKCRAAFQNFPFNSEKLVGNVHIIDWGCGQAIATMCFCEMLKERGFLQQVNKITLIEPSQAALNRAVLHVGKVTKGSAEIETLTKYLPSINGGGLRHIEYCGQTIIHLFSNILDIEDIDLIALARLISSKGKNQYILSAGPCNNGMGRLHQFASLFNPKEFISSITSPRYSYTTDTLHPYSCYTRCFHYSGWSLQLPEQLPTVSASTVGGVPVIDEYDINTFVQNGAISQNVAQIYEYLSNILEENDSIYLKPSINGDVPDIVVVRPNKGVLLLVVFEDDILDYRWKGSEDQVIDYPYEDDEKRYLYSLIDKDGCEISSPTCVVDEYRQNIIKLHMEDILGRALVIPGYWGIVKKAVFFPHNTQNEIDSYFSILKDDYVVCLGKESLDLPADKFLEVLHYNTYNRNFDSIIKNSFTKIISPKWHSFKDGREDYSLSKKQEPLAKSEPSTVRKIGGVAGSGKTQVMAARAVNAQIRTGKEVLVLTFNLTLINYIKYRIGEVRKDFPWDKIHITNYHQFFKSQAANYNLNSKVFGCYRDVTFFEPVADKIVKYDTIIIDEVQDYEESWLRIVKKYFLSENGEFVVFGDVKQNIYKRKLDEEKHIIIPDSKGVWNMSLNCSFRFSDILLARMMMSFQEEFYDGLDIDEITIEQDMFAQPCLIKYANVGTNITADTLFRYCKGSIVQYANGDYKNTVILSQACDILRDIDKHFRDNKHFTLTTFESAEQYSSLKEHHTNGNRLSSAFKNDIDSIRRNKKLHFTMDTSYLKLSTIHSYKGWEANTVILIIAPLKDGRNNIPYAISPEENIPELIYTAITRVRKNLMIINCGNMEYHDFFNRHKQ